MPLHREPKRRDEARFERFDDTVIAAGGDAQVSGDPIGGLMVA
jgi:hypothetical protein